MYDSWMDEKGQVVIDEDVLLRTCLCARQRKTLSQLFKDLLPIQSKTNTQQPRRLFLRVWTLAVAEEGYTWRREDAYEK